MYVQVVRRVRVPAHHWEEWGLISLRTTVKIEVWSLCVASGLAGCFNLPQGTLPSQQGSRQGRVLLVTSDSYRLFCCLFSMEQNWEGCCVPLHIFPSPIETPLCQVNIGGDRDMWSQDRGSDWQCQWLYQQRRNSLRPNWGEMQKQQKTASKIIMYLYVFIYLLVKWSVHENGIILPCTN